MKAILQKWLGKFEIDNKVYDNLDNVVLKDGEEFHIILLGEQEDGRTTIKDQIRGVR